MLRLNFEVIPHREQRLPDTVGDYWLDDDGVIQVRVSRLGDAQMEFLVGLHEIVEALLVKAAGLPFQHVDLWDREHPPKDDFDEPGDRPDAPYAFQHTIASTTERLAALLLGVNYQAYENRLGELLK